MKEAKFRSVPTACDPSEHSTPMAVDSVPHHLRDKASNLLKANCPIKLNHTDRHFVATSFTDKSVGSNAIIRLSTGCANAGI